MAGLNGLGEVPDDLRIRSEDDPEDVFSISGSLNGHSRNKKKKVLERNGHSKERESTFKSEVARRLERKRVEARAAAVGLLAMMTNDEDGIIAFSKIGGKPVDRAGTYEYLLSLPNKDPFVDNVLKMYRPNVAGDIRAEIEYQEEVNAAE